MGFFDTIARGWKMSKLSWAVVRKDPELLVYTLLSGIMVMAVGIVGYLPELLDFGWVSTNSDTGQMTVNALYYLWAFGTYMGISIVVVFWNSAIVANAHIRLTGGDPKFIDGVAVAFSRIHVIILWGLVAGTVGLLFRALHAFARQQDNMLTRILISIFAWILEVAWWMTTFFIIPVLIVEKKGVTESMKESKDLFRRTWGENITSGWGIGIITFLFVLLALVIAIPLALISPLVGIIVGAILIGLVVMWGSAAEVVSKAALYIFARSGRMPDLYVEQGMTEYRF